MSAHVPVDCAVVVTVSDRCATAQTDDLSGPALVTALRKFGMACMRPTVIEDGRESVRLALVAALRDAPALIVTTGGTGIHPRDFTPEGTAAVLSRELPGIAEALRRRGLARTPHAVLSRGLAGVVDHPGGTATLVVNLPGSPAAVEEGLEVLLPLLPHILSQLRGGDHAPTRR